MRRRVVAVAVLWCLTAPACIGFVRRSEIEAARSPRSYGSGIQSLEAVETGRSGAGTYLIRTVDSFGAPVVGATVTAQQRGRVQKRATTGADGVARLTLPTGWYVISVAGCGESVIVQRAAEASALVRPGKTDTATLRVQAWRRRYKPSPSVTMSVAPPWRIGQRVRVSIRIEDGCQFDAAPGAPLESFGWRTSGNLGLARRPPARADARGRATVTVVCLARGDAHLLIYDRANPDEHIDLLVAGRAPPPGRHTCE